MSIMPAHERLTILRQKDGYRDWQTLEDQRVCLLCRRTFTGREIGLRKGSNGEIDLSCPTEGCNSTPQDWFYYGSARAPSRPAPQDAPRTVEIDLDFL